MNIEIRFFKSLHVNFEFFDLGFFLAWICIYESTDKWVLIWAIVWRRHFKQLKLGCFQVLLVLILLVFSWGTRWFECSSKRILGYSLLFKSTLIILIWRFVILIFDFHIFFNYSLYSFVSINFCFYLLIFLMLVTSLHRFSH